VINGKGVKVFVKVFDKNIGKQGEEKEQKVKH